MYMTCMKHATALATRTLCNRCVYVCVSLYMGCCTHTHRHTQAHTYTHIHTHTIYIPNERYWHWIGNRMHMSVGSIYNSEILIYIQKKI